MPTTKQNPKTGHSSVITISERLKQLRVYFGLSQEAMGKLGFVSAPGWIKLENGQRLPSDQLLRKLRDWMVRERYFRAAEGDAVLEELLTRKHLASNQPFVRELAGFYARNSTWGRELMADVDGAAKPQTSAVGIVRPLPTDPEGFRSETFRFELVAGECRWRAAETAGLELVPCIIRDLDDLAAIRVQAVENLQRRDINALEEAEGYNLLMRRGQYTVLDIHRETGKSEATIRARLKLLEAPPGIRKALVEGRLPASTAELVARIEDVAFQGQAMDAILFPEDGEAEEGADVLSFRQAKAWIESRREAMVREADWSKRAKESHVIKDAAQILTAAQSDKVLLSGGYVRDSQAWVKPTDPCPADPEGRTYEQLAKAGECTLPAPTVAREPINGAPVVLIPRQEADRAVKELVPSIEEQERRRREETQKRRDADEQSAKVREAAAFEKARRADGVVLRCVATPWDTERDLAFLRLLVGGIFEQFVDEDPDDLEKALKANGLPDLLPGEVDEEWCEEYLDGCDADRLRGWLLFFHLRYRDAGEGLTKAASIDLDRVIGAEAIFPAAKPQFSSL